MAAAAAETAAAAEFRILFYLAECRLSVRRGGFRLFRHTAQPVQKCSCCFYTFQTNFIFLRMHCHFISAVIEDIRRRLRLGCRNTHRRIHHTPPVLPLCFADLKLPDGVLIGPAKSYPELKQ